MTKGELQFATLADRLLWARKQKRMTQVELHKKSGVSQGTISDIERGRTVEGYAGTLLRLAAALEVNLHWLQTGKGEPLGESGADIQSVIELLNDLTPEQLSIAKGLLSVLKTP